MCVGWQAEAFNVEEESFGWQTTTYPVRLQTINTLKPYLTLYELTVDFENKYKYAVLYVTENIEKHF